MRLVVAGGGTGGHLYPGIAVARQAMKDGGRTLFIGTAAGIEARVLPREGLDLVTISAGKFKGMGALGKLKTMLALPAGMVQAARAMRKFQADVLLGVGGYASFPACMAAALAGIPVVIQEQNAFPGLANRVAGRFAKVIALGFADAAGFFPAGRSTHTGNPVRAGLAGADRLDSLDAFGLDENVTTVLVFGGSAGAHRINTAVTGAAKMLRLGGANIQYLHQTGEKDFDIVKASYEQAGVKAAVLPYIHDMAGAYATASLVVCRAGAMTIAEVTMLGKPAVLIPYPHAANNHQEVNARVLERAGAGRVVLDAEAQPGRMADEISAMLADDAGLARMADNSRSLGRPDSAATVYGICKGLSGA